MTASDSLDGVSDGSGAYKLHYFNLFARGEPIRMALWYAKVPHQDHVVPFDYWRELKPQLPFGQLPALELPDGRFLAQTDSILQYIG